MKIRQLCGWIAILLVSLLVTINCNPSLKPIYTNSPNISSSKTPIRLAFTPWPPSLNWQIAEEEKIFQANQIEVNLNYYDYLQSVQKLTAGEIDANQQTLSDTIIGLAEPASPDLVIILSTDLSYGGDAIIVRSGIKSLADLKGKKIATERGGIDHFLLLLGLKKAGINPKDIQLINLDQRASVASFIEGQVDAVGVYIPYSKEALKRPGSRVLFSSRDFPQAIPSHLVVHRKIIDERPEDVQALVKSWFDTLKVVRQDPEKSYKSMANYIGVSVGEFKSYNSEIKILSLADNLKSFSLSGNGGFLPVVAEEMSKFLLANGIIKTRPDLSRLFDDSFVKAYVNSVNKQR